MEPANTLDALRQPSGGQLPAGAVFDEHVVMRFGPIVADEHSAHRYLLIVVRFEPEATSSLLMDQCSQHAIPPAITVNLTDQQAHDLTLELLALRSKSADLLAAR